MTRVLEKTKPTCNHGHGPRSVSSQDIMAEPAAEGQACLAEPGARSGADATCGGEMREEQTQTQVRGAEECHLEFLQHLPPSPTLWEPCVDLAVGGSVGLVGGEEFTHWSHRGSHWRVR